MTNIDQAMSVTSKTYTKRTSIFDRNLNRIRGAEISQAAFSFLFAEIVRYTQKRVDGMCELEKRLNGQGYKVGQKLLELVNWREKKYRRETKVLGILQCT